MGSFVQRSVRHELIGGSSLRYIIYRSGLLLVVLVGLRVNEAACEDHGHIPLRLFILIYINPKSTRCGSMRWRTWNHALQRDRTSRRDPGLAYSTL